MAAQVNRRRTALAEIPVRMSQLRVSTDEMPPVLNRTVVDSPLDNIPIGYLTPSPSQDECKLFSSAGAPSPQNNDDPNNLFPIFYFFRSISKKKKQK